MEFVLPSAAARGKAAVDKIESDMRPDSKKARVRLPESRHRCKGQGKAQAAGECGWQWLVSRS